MSVATPAPPPPLENTATGVIGEYTLPASWWTSDKVFEFEKRSIFARSWLYTSHTSRFQKAGDYFAYNFLGWNFFLIKSTNGNIKAFHNVCRHRAYPVIRKERGSSIILGCKYHGWSYGTDGKLRKAPQFDNVQGFNREDNSLFEIKTHVTKQGLIFVNFDNTEDSVPFETFFKGLETELSEFDFGDYEYHMSYELDGKFNWKTLMDGYQECYHCPTAHPGLNAAFKMETYKVVPKGNYCRHYCRIAEHEIAVQDAKEADPDTESSWFGFGRKKQQNSEPVKVVKKENPGGSFDGLWCYLFPTNGINCYSPAWYSIRVLPITANRTILQYDIFTKKGIEEEKKKEFVDFLQQVEIEDYDLCVLTQKNLREGIYSSGCLHPTKERGVLHYQGLVRDMVKKHFEAEQKAGKEINPATVGGAEPKEVQELEALCAKIEGKGEAGKECLEW
ncbi:DEKNAAC103880 [Brettanomyces naardenensis]|uniref:Choline monooxygenase, chloroplastic n=1 Tax=Brettanomyces naardenensis TaxID=13370 RepID=A0A448YPF2_BRENA|nr:DEKNAAC103880 [Brettanomyces naardenensis]